MPQRAVSLLYALGGLLTAASMLLIGCDLLRAARRGPLWKRRLLGAGVAVLAALGLAVGCDEAEGKPPDGDAPSAVRPSGARAGDLAGAPEWKRLSDVWREAEQVASGARGAYPFDRKGQEKLLARLDQAKGDVESLRRGGLLSGAEAGLLTRDLALLADGVRVKRPRELMNATCYAPMLLQPGRESAARLADRLPLLDKLAEQEDLRPDVVERVLATVEKDLAVLGVKRNLSALDEAARQQAAQVREKAAADVQRIRGRLSAGSGGGTQVPLEDTPQWRTITAAWREAAPLAESGKRTPAQREKADVSLKAAVKAAEALAAAGALTPSEAGLLSSEIGRLQAAIHANPPTDCQFTCYDMAWLPPAHASLDRLAQRLPLLQKLAQEGKVHRAALEKVAGSIEDDLKMLGDPKQIGQLPEDRRRKAEALAAEVRKALDEVRRLAAEAR